MFPVAEDRVPSALRLGDDLTQVLVGSSSATTHSEVEESICDGPRKWSIVDREPCASLSLCKWIGRD